MDQITTADALRVEAKRLGIDPAVLLKLAREISHTSSLRSLDHMVGRDLELLWERLNEITVRELAGVR